MSSFKKKIEVLLKTNRFVQVTYSFFGSLFFKFVGLFVKQDKKLILFSSFSGDQINDSPKVIYQYIRENYPNFKCVWAVNDSRKAEGYDFIIIDTFKYFKTALKARYWVTNVNIERGLHFKKRKTFYLNTWHGTAIKTIGNLVKGRKDYNFKKIDFLCSDGDFMKDIFIRGFKANPDQIFNCGRPREDRLIFSDPKHENEKARKALNIGFDKTVILYAPTWENCNGREDLLNVKLDLDELTNKLGKNYIVLLRTHHLTKKVNDLHLNKQIIDVTNYPYINDLYFAADILISDYSSCFFDYGLLDKPMLCFAPTYDNYVKERGVFIDMEKEFPYGVIKELDDLVKDINEVVKDGVPTKQNEFMKKYVDRPKESATKFCVERMIERMIVK